MRIHHPSARRLAAALSALALTPALTLAVASPAHAATPFIVVGTSDVSDSNLMAAVIEPGFEAAYPQYDLQYVPKGTGAAITYAEGGSAAAMIVHAASLENQFVDQGYSLEPYGRAIFWGDYVLAGPKSDPAGVLNGSQHDIVGALEKVAAAGAAGTANFVGRGGTPGTATQERALWALTGSQVSKCAVGSANGGGSSPSTSSAPCPNLNTIPYPSWYHTGDSASQANNVSIANTCAFTGGNCYVFTDRGTFNYQQSIGNDQNLQIVTRDNTPTARGGLEALVNAFHAYGVNPAKFPGNATVSSPATKLFLNFITSPAEQQAIGQFLGAAKPFIPAAAPKLTAAVRTGALSKSGNTQITGNLSTAIPGYPALSYQKVTLLQSGSSSPLAIPKVVDSATTDSSGNYVFATRLKPGRSYSVGVPQIYKIESLALNPIFGDSLQPTTTLLGRTPKLALKPIVAKGSRSVLVRGRLSPKVVGSSGRLFIYASKAGGTFKQVGRVKLSGGASKFLTRVHLAQGTWRIQVGFVNGSIGQVPTTSLIQRVKLS